MVLPQKSEILLQPQKSNLTLNSEKNNLSQDSSDSDDSGTYSEMCFISFGSDSDEEKSEELVETKTEDRSKKAFKMLIRKSLKIEENEENELKSLTMKKQTEKVEELMEDASVTDETKSAKEEIMVSNEDDKIIYKLTYDIIEKLKDQSESYIKALAKDLLAEFFLFRNLKVKAKNHWIECLDSIFKQVCVLEQFDSLFNIRDNKTDFVATFGQKKLYLALLILYKLSKFIFMNK